MCHPQTMKRDTLYVQVFAGDRDPERLPPEDWHPWINCKGDQQQTVLMAGHKFVRQRGGLGGDRLRVVVYSYWKGAPEHRPGCPMCVDKHELIFTPQTATATN